MQLVGFSGRGDLSDEQRSEWMRRQRQWSEPENVMPVAWPFTALLARTDEVALSVLGGQAFPNGLAFTFLVRLRHEPKSFGPGGTPFGRHLFHQRHLGSESPEQILRFGVRYADGRVVTNLDDPGWSPVAEDVDDDQPQLRPTGGGGGGRTWRQGYFLCPLPPDGPLEMVTEWPAYAIAETQIVLDLDGLSAAVASAIELWPEEPQPPAELPKLRFGDSGARFFKPILGPDGDLPTQ